MDYKKYIQSSDWRKKRKQLIDKIGYECEQCGYNYNLEVHHKTYDNLGKEPLEDLQLLCRQCHLSKHEKWFNKVYSKKNKNTLSLKQKFKMLETPKGRKKLKRMGYKL